MKTEDTKSGGKKPDKRLRIMKAAIDLFRERGYDGTRIIDIAGRAGIGKGTVYEYFACKDDLMSELIRDVVLVDYMEFYSEASMLTAGDGIYRRLDAHLAGSEKMIERYGLYAKIFFDQIVDNSKVDSSGAMKMVKEMTDDQRLRIRNIISEEAEIRAKAGDKTLDEAGIDKAASVTILLIASYMLSLIQRGSGGKDGDLLYSEVSEVNRSMVVEYIVKGIGF